MKKLFYKMHGLGNDYIYFDCLSESIADPQNVSIILSDRHFSIGSDGIVLICPSDTADAKMRIFNADGSEAKMCGNATRCVGKLMYEKLGFKKPIIRLETLSGIKVISLNIENGEVVSAKVDMGYASFEPEKVPVSSGSPYIDREITIGGKTFRTTSLSVGNPHTVTIVDSPDSFELEQYGPLFECSPLFPDKVNAEFISVIDRQNIKMRVWERGSGETLACGTGACASAAAAVKLGLCDADTPITVSLPGGELIITVSADYSLLMEGPCVLSYVGEVDCKYF